MVPFPMCLQEGRTRILHRNLLLPVGFIREQEIPQEKPKPVPRPRMRQQKSIPVAVNPSTQAGCLRSLTDLLIGTGVFDSVS
jgi:hypothetical protein